MAERIYVRRRDGGLEGLQEETFGVEDDLQKLIAEHPEVIDGEQIRPDDARRWILIAREKGIAETSDTGARWSLDHLIIDQDARPTLVEAKLRDNSDIHRKIVGQMLEYAAHAAETWTADELRRAFEESERVRGRDPDEVLAELRLEDEPDVDGFWDLVATNLKANRLRLLFIADRIPDRLARVVGFLNGQMQDIEVLAVEVKRFHGNSGEIFVPRVIGRTAKAGLRGSSGQSSKLTRDSFLADFGSDLHREAAVRLLDAAERSGASLLWGKYLVTVAAQCSLWAGPPVKVAWLCSPLGLQKWKSWTRGITFGTHIHEDHPEELRRVLARWADRSLVPFAQEAANKGSEGWTVSHDDAAKHIDDLVERLENVLSELRALSRERATGFLRPPRG